jgi:hypothetical protein
MEVTTSISWREDFCNIKPNTLVLMVLRRQYEIFDRVVVSLIDDNKTFRSVEEGKEVPISDKDKKLYWHPLDDLTLTIPPSPVLSPRIKVWTRHYSPFILGGSVNRIISCVVYIFPTDYNLGKGARGYVSKIGNNFYVVEKETHGIVGSGVTEEEALDNVKKDVLTCTVDDLRKQLSAQMGYLEKSDLVSLEEFSDFLEGKVI